MGFADRVSVLKSEELNAILSRARELESQGKEIIHLEMDQPDFVTPPGVVVAAVKAIVSGHARDISPAGMMSLRKAIAGDAGSYRQVRVDWEQVFIAPGTTPMILLSMMALLNEGDEVIIPDPGFPSYEASVRMAGATPMPVPLVEENGYDLDVDRLESIASPRTKLIVLNSPSNPTGGIITQQTLTRVARIARRYDSWILSDEIYSRMVYEGNASSIVNQPGMKERTIIVDGFSKAYSMTDLHLGFGIMPKEIAKKVELIMPHFIGYTSPFTQFAGLEALKSASQTVESMRTEYQYRRDFVVSALNDIPGVTCEVPKGAFYVFPNISSYQMSGERMANYLLDEAGVALLPGTAFGSNGEKHLRISYANSLENLKEAMNRIRVALAKVQPARQ